MNVDDALWLALAVAAASVVMGLPALLRAWRSRRNEP